MFISAKARRGLVGDVDDVLIYSRTGLSGRNSGTAARPRSDGSGIAMSADGNTLAIGDATATAVYTR